MWNQACDAIDLDKGVSKMNYRLTKEGQDLLAQGVYPKYCEIHDRKDMIVEFLYQIAQSVIIAIDMGSNLPLIQVVPFDCLKKVNDIKGGFES
jgi:hypothetical protein